MIHWKFIKRYLYHSLYWNLRRKKDTDANKTWSKKEIRDGWMFGWMVLKQLILPGVICHVNRSSLINFSFYTIWRKKWEYWKWCNISLWNETKKPKWSFFTLVKILIFVSEYYVLSLIFWINFKRKLIIQTEMDGWLRQTILCTFQNSNKTSSTNIISFLNLGPKFYASFSALGFLSQKDFKLEKNLSLYCNGTKLFKIRWY